MLSETSCVAMISVFCSFALIFFLAFYILKVKKHFIFISNFQKCIQISGYDLKEELIEGKGYDLFPLNESTEKFLDNEGSNDEDRQLYLNNSFIKIYAEVQQYLSEMFKKQTTLVFVSMIFFGIFVLVLPKTKTIDNKFTHF